MFKEGDRVFDIVNGWGEITYLYNYDWEKLASEHLACVVKFHNGEERHYTKDVALKLLSFTEYGFDERFSQERPVNYEDYIGKYGKFWDDDKESPIIIGKLSKYCPHLVRCFETKDRIDRINGYNRFELLTEEQIKVLGL